jgi:hypothetical protein
MTAAPPKHKPNFMRKNALIVVQSHEAARCPSRLPLVPFGPVIAAH